MNKKKMIESAAISHSKSIKTKGTIYVAHHFSWLK